MTVRIYGIAASRALRPIWVMEEAGAPYEHVPVDYRGGAPRSPQMLALNPNGRIPVVDDDGLIIWESMACALYLARKYGGAFAPRGDAEEAAALMWSFWAMTECEKDALHVLMHRVGLPEAERKPQLADEAARRLAAPLKVIDDHLATREWLAGERFTVADICAASVLAWVRVAKALPPERPQLARWLQACVSRPSFVRARSVGTQAAQPAS